LAETVPRSIVLARSKVSLADDRRDHVTCVK